LRYDHFGTGRFVVLMNVNFLEGAHDRSDQGLRGILRAQANVRLGVAIPVIVADLVIFFISSSAIPMWFAALTFGYFLYALSPFWFMRKASVQALEVLIVASAVSDPLVLSVWIAVTGKFGALIAGLYLFTTLGFGFRTGRPLMHLCQIVSIADFCLVLALEPYWQENIVIWSALLVPLIVVPLYAGTLIKTLRQAREHAEQQSRAKSDLLAKVSHELRTPLTGIVAAAELLSVESNDRHVNTRTETILTLSENLLCEINDLLDEAKYENSALRLQPQTVDLHRQVESLRTTFETLAAKKGIAFRASIAPDIADCVETDAHYLNRILLNLIGNAIKFTEKGSVKLTVELLHQNETEYRVRFGVADTGIGIPESFHATMFQPFSQVEQGSERRYGGTGLGLALSKNILDSMGSKLQFESETGRGSRFWFELTLPRSENNAQRKATPAETSIIAPLRVLVVEDNRTTLVLMEEMLKIDKHVVTSCGSGIEALDVLSSQEFDVLLLDYNLGDMDGARLLQAYRFGRKDTAPALFLTADATTRTTERLIEAGGAGVLHKPVTLAGMRKALAQMTAGSEVPVLVEQDPVVAPAPELVRLERPALRIVPVSPLDQELLEELGSLHDGPEFLIKLLSHAQDDIARCSQQLSDALSSRNYAVVPSVAHALKGVSANVGANRLAVLAGSLMQLSSDEVDSSRDRLGADLRECAQVTVAALRKTIADSRLVSASG
jgi:two-component system sensor histidine kinase RpfC